MKKLLLLVLLLSASFGFSQNYNVTFRVDMSEVGAINTIVSVTGDFQYEAGYSADWTPGITQMTDPDMDSIYEITVSLPAGTYQYLFVNGDSWGMVETVPGACAVSGNREYVVNADVVLPVVCYAACTSCQPPVLLYDLTFNVDMSQEAIIHDTVSVVGDFQSEAGYVSDWTPGITVLTDPDLDKIYSLTVTIPSGVYAYKFVNGVAWGQDEIIPGPCSVNGNREVNLTAGTLLDPVCYSGCTLCGGSSVPDNDITASLSFANPVRDVLRLDFGIWSAGKKRIEIIDCRGAIVLITETSEQVCTLSAAALVPGFYMLRATRGTEVFQQKFVKE